MCNTAAAQIYQIQERMPRTHAYLFPMGSVRVGELAANVQMEIVLALGASNIILTYVRASAQQFGKYSAVAIALEEDNFDASCLEMLKKAGEKADRRCALGKLYGIMLPGDLALMIAVDHFIPGRSEAEVSLQTALQSASFVVDGKLKVGPATHELSARYARAVAGGFEGDGKLIRLLVRAMAKSIDHQLTLRHPRSEATTSWHEYVIGHVNETAALGADEYADDHLNDTLTDLRIIASEQTRRAELIAAVTDDGPDVPGVHQAEVPVKSPEAHKEDMREKGQVHINTVHSPEMEVLRRSRPKQRRPPYERWTRRRGRT